MLDFYLGTGGIDDPGEHLGGLSAEAVHWLQQHDFIIRGETGHLPDDVPESFPIGDDVILSYEQVLKAYQKFSAKLTMANSTPGFKSSDVDTLKKILETAINKKSGISTIAD